jgi:mannosyltransferase
MIKAFRVPLFLVVLTVAGFVTRFYHLGYHSLWLDEIGQVVVSGFSLNQLLDAVGGHLSPPLDYLLLKLFLVFGSSDTIVRLPACLYGTASIPIIYFLGRKVFGELPAIIAAIMLALSPMAVAFSQEVRMYSLFLLMALVSYLVIINFLEKPTIKRAAILGVVNGALLLTHYFGFIVAGVEMTVCLIVAFRKGWTKEWLFIFSALLLSILLFVPWIPMLLQQIKNSGGQIGYALPTGKDFFKFIFNAFSIHTGGEEGPWYYGFILAFIAGVVLVVKDKNIKTIILAAGFITVIVCSYAFSFFKPIVTTRNLIFLVPVYLLVSAYAVNRLREAVRLNIWIMAALVLVLLIPPVYHYHAAGRPDFKPDWKRAAEFLERNSQPGDKIVIPDRYSRGCLAYYLEPNADYVFMKPGWIKEVNVLENRIWLIRPDRAKMPKEAWLVIPPQSLPGLGRDEYKKMVENNTPAASFKTQGKGNPLEIYRLD